MTTKKVVIIAAITGLLVVAAVFRFSQAKSFVTGS